MTSLLKPKNIRRIIVGLVLLAPIVYLFGTQIAALAGAHGDSPIGPEEGAQVVTGYETRDFNQLVYNGNFVDDDGWRLAYNADLTIADNVASVKAVQQFSSISTNCELVSNHKYLITFNYAATATGWCVYAINGASTDYVLSKQYLSSNTFTAFSYFFTSSVTTSQRFHFQFDWSNPNDTIIRLSDICLFDLTQIYGDGLEPSTVAAFRADYPSSYYDYVVSNIEYFPIYSTATPSSWYFGQMFPDDNFLSMIGESVFSPHPLGFAPVADLFRYVDNSFLHVSSMPMGLLGYGYMYYVVHVLLLDLVAMAFVFIVSIPERILDQINGKTGGDW